jgi:ubiquitin-conjugating enzyme E2 Q
MAICFNTLKQDIRRLEAIFPKTHKCFQLISATVDEVVCRFIARSGKKYDIFANFTVSVIVPLNLMSHLIPLTPSQETYPEMPPVWFSESEETFVSTIVQSLSESEGADNYVSTQRN